MRLAYITISNTRDVLPQKDWAQYITRTRWHISTYCTFAEVAFAGEWHSPADAENQNVCWAVELSPDPERVLGLQEALVACTLRFKPGTGIMWAVTDDAEILMEQS